MRLLHYHGTPLTPRDNLYRMAGKHFCVSFADPRDAEVCLAIGQSVMWDNGAFTFHTQSKQSNWNGYYRWLEYKLAPPHWAVVPDVIDADHKENIALAKEWPHRKDCSAYVWHLHEPLDVIFEALDMGFAKICFGSSKQYWQIGTDAWQRRIDEAFNFLSRRGPLPWIHMLRGMDCAGKRWPFASVDSVNVARNYKDQNTCPEFMARTIDAVQGPLKWKVRPEQETLI